MIKMIEESYLNGKNIPEDKINFINPIETITSLYPDLNKIVKDNELLYKLESNGKEKNIKISYQKEFKPDYCIIRESTHDGTSLFVLELLNEVVYPLLDSSSYCKYNAPTDYIENFLNYDIEYLLGDIYYFSDFGLKNINGNTIQGQDDVMILPVKIKYQKKI